MPCDNCSKNATCVCGHCMCNDGYSGNGTTCEGMCFSNVPCWYNEYLMIILVVTTCETCSEHAVCDQECMCMKGYTGDGITCESKCCIFYHAI